MRGVYEASYKITSLSAAKTLMYITAPADACIEILSIEITNTSNETNEQCEATFQKVNSLGTPTATSVTPTPTEAGDQAASATVAANVTASEPTYVSGVEFGRKGFPSLGGYIYSPIPEERPVLAPSSSWGLRLLNSPSSLDSTVTIRFREIG